MIVAAERRKKGPAELGLSRALRSAGVPDGLEAVAGLAKGLAVALDDPSTSGSAKAAISREYRELLCELGVGGDAGVSRGEGVDRGVASDPGVAVLANLRARAARRGNG